MDEDFPVTAELKARLDGVMGWLDALVKAEALGLVLAVLMDLPVDGYVYSWLIWPIIGVLSAGHLLCWMILYLDHCRYCDDCGGWVPRRYRKAQRFSLERKRKGAT
jgi:hypothetical protein